MTPIIGARKTEKELRTVMSVVARLISCHGWTTQHAIKVIKAPYEQSDLTNTTEARKTHSPEVNITWPETSQIDSTSYHVALERC
jgi:hypothetical protein